MDKKERIVMDMKNYILNYNWDDGNQGMKNFIKNNSLTISELMQVFYDAGGYEYLMEGMKKEIVLEKKLLDNQDILFLDYLYELILSIEKKQSEVELYFDLNKTQRYKIRKKNPSIPLIFVSFKTK